MEVRLLINHLARHNAPLLGNLGGYRDLPGQLGLRNLFQCDAGALPGLLLPDRHDDGVRRSLLISSNFKIKIKVKDEFRTVTV